MSARSARAAVLERLGDPWQLREVVVGEPQAGEVLVRMAYAGLCYSDEHVRNGDVADLPLVGGHEGSGVVEAVGPGVDSLAPGDHVVLTFVPMCGRCHWCVTGRANLCEDGDIGSGRMRDGTFRFTAEWSPRPDGGIGSFCGLGTFAEYAVVSSSAAIPVDKSVPLEVAALVSCGVLTGWGSAVRTAQVATGQTVVVVGGGGIGINAIQGARHAGARHIVAVDPVVAKHEIAREVGATHAVTSILEAAALAAELNPVARGADATIVATGNLNEAVVGQAFDATGKGGIVVIAGMSHDPEERNVVLPGTVMATQEKRVAGSFLGSCAPLRDIPLLLALYQQGQLQLDRLISRTYALEEIEQGYADLAAGRNLRGLIAYDG